MRRLTLAQWVSIDRARNRYRQYTIELGEDLWGDLCVVKSWGRIGRSPRQRLYWPKSDLEFTRLLQGTIRQRIRHGYRMGRMA